MSRYAWPARRKHPDRPLARAGWNARTDGLVTARAVLQARENRQEALARRAVSRAPEGQEDLWVPVGPSVALKGQSSGRPRVAGRVRDLAVSPDGTRAYAATANGGVWFTADSGSTWNPVSNWLPTPGEPSTRLAQSVLTCGCIHVRFGPGADQDNDEVHVGTGELRPWQQGTPGLRNGGVGVLRLKTPITQAIANPFADHWEREAPNLSGFGVFRLARDPEDPEVIVAVTSGGVYSRSGPSVPDGDWDPIDSGPLGFDADDGITACDALWIPSDPSRLVIAIYGERTGVYLSEDGIEGDFDRIDLPDLQVGRIALTSCEAQPEIMYVLGKGPRLYRVTFSETERPAVQRVANLPDSLFGSDKKKDSSSYNMAVAVEPANADRVFIGGQSAWDGEHAAALFRATLITDTHNNLTFGFADSHQALPANDATFIGRGVHADVHRIVLLTVGSDVHGWVACDGGVFRSTTSGIKGSYDARNTGLAVLEGGYLASHPINDHFVILGTQDNGVLQRVGDSVWLHTKELTGDGGGVAFHPGTPRYFVGQYTNASWLPGVIDAGSTGLFVQPVLRGVAFAKDSEDKENDAASFYSGIDTAPGAVPQTTGKAAIGTNRVWVSTDWRPTTSLFNSWQTLPSGIDPRDRNPRDYGTDVMDQDHGAVTATRWADDGRLFVLRERTVLVFSPPSSAGSTKWSVEVLTKTESVCGDYEDSDIELPSSDYLPPLGAWSDLAIDDPTSAATACYVACTGHATLDDNDVTESTRMDTLWWYDGNGKWWSTGLRNDDATDSTGVAAPAYAVLVDPDNRTIVYVGTALGVWKGSREMDGTTPTWLWEPFDNGLPEAPVHDLSLFRLHNSVKLLRAAVQGRGVWELDLSPVKTPVQRLYLRSHPNDARRMTPADLTNPTSAAAAVWPWYISPDIRVADPADPDPWGAGAPTEADFLERDDAGGPAVPETLDPAAHSVSANVGLLPPLGSYSAAMFVADAVYRVHVLVHYRDLTAVPAAQVHVGVFIRPVGHAVSEWEAVKVPKTVTDAVTALLTAGAAWPGGLEMAPIEAANPRRSPAAAVDARTPRVVTFDLDLRGMASGDYLLFAVASAATDPVSWDGLENSTVQNVVLNSHHAGVRFIRKI